MSDLPAALQETGSFFQNPLAMSDPDYRRTLIDWGYQQIDAEYPLDPVRAPLNRIRRQLAINAWNNVIRTGGRELRTLVAGQATEELRFQLQRRQSEILADDAERRNRRQLELAAAAQAAAFDHTSTAQHRQAMELMRLQHDLAEQAADAASRRRQHELGHQTDQEIATRIIDNWLKSSGSTSTEATIRATRLVNEEITRIRRDPTLSPDEQHLHIKSLLDSLPTLLRNLRPLDV